MTTRRVVRRFGTERTHVVDIPAELLEPANVFGSDFTAVTLPVIAVCGVEVRVSRSWPVAVCMVPGSPVKCAACRRLSHLDTAPIDNTALPREPVS